MAKLEQIQYKIFSYSHLECNRKVVKFALLWCNQ